MMSVQMCRKEGKAGCEHLKNAILESKTELRCVSVCEKTGKEPRYMIMCPDVEAML